MVVGPCTCSTTNCQHTAGVNGCGGTSTGEYFCDGDKLFYDVNSFVYNQEADADCNASGGSTTLSCQCSLRELTASPSYSPPGDVVSGGFQPVEWHDHVKYNNHPPLGPCQCDLAFVEDQVVLGYASYGNNVSAAYCDGDLLGYIYDQPNGNLIFQCNFGPNYSPTIAQGPGYKLCRCIPSKAEYYGASSLAATPIAGVIPIQTRVATLGSSSGAMAAVSSPFSLGGCLLTASLALTLGTWLH